MLTIILVITFFIARIFFKKVVTDTIKNDLKIDNLSLSNIWSKTKKYINSIGKKVSVLFISFSHKMPKQIDREQLSSSNTAVNYSYLRFEKSQSKPVKVFGFRVHLLSLVLVPIIYGAAIYFISQTGVLHHDNSGEFLRDTPTALNNWLFMIGFFLFIGCWSPLFQMIYVGRNLFLLQKGYLVRIKAKVCDSRTIHIN